MALPITLNSLSGPVMPGETVMCSGWNFDDNCVAVISRYSDGSPILMANAATNADDSVEAAAALTVPPIQVRSGNLKFILPTSTSGGVFKVYIVNRLTSKASNVLNVNQPEPYWMQNTAVRMDTPTNTSIVASPGDVVRIFGRGFTVPGAPATSNSSVRVQFSATGSATQIVQLPAANVSDYMVAVPVPASLPEGTWTVAVHNGYGGSGMWATVPETLIMTSAPAAWPSNVFNVASMGLSAAVTAVTKNKGGVLYFPTGRYTFTTTIKLPPYTVMKGDGMNATNLTWSFKSTDGGTPPSAMITGSIFVVQDIAIYSQGPFVNGIVTPADATYACIRRTIFRANPYMLTYQGSAPAGTHLTMGSFAYLCGCNFELSGCDVYAPNLIFVLDGSVTANINNNTFGFGGQGFIANSGDRLIIENNTIAGNTFTSSGDVVQSQSVVTASKVQDRTWYANNNHAFILGEARQPLAHMGDGSFYCGTVRSSNGVTVVLNADPAPLPTTLDANWVGAAFIIVGGRGQGQLRRIVSITGRSLTLNQSLGTGTDPSSIAVITFYRGHTLIVGNTFADCGAVSLGGAAFDSVFARNTITRSEGLVVRGSMFTANGWMPSLNVLVADNLIAEGNSWGNVAASFTLQGDAASSPLTILCTLKRNTIRNNGWFTVTNNVTDAVIERNTVVNTTVAVTSSGSSLGSVVLAYNSLKNVGTAISGPGASVFLVIG